MAKLTAKAAEKVAKQAAKQSKQGGASTSHKRSIPSDSKQDRTQRKAPKLAALNLIDPSVVFALDFTRMMWVLAANGYSAAALDGSTRTV